MNSLVNSIHATGTRADSMSAILKVDSLTCAFNENELFQGISFDLVPGDVLQVFGANGSGKTTLLRILCGLKRPDEGCIYWQDKDVRDLESEYFENLAFIGHLSGIKSGLTVSENLEQQCMLAGTGSTCDRQNVLERIGLAYYASTPAAHLSTGQRRRLALARLLVGEARIWLLDEPYTSLDETGRLLVNELLLKHSHGGGIAIIATHEPVGPESLNPRSFTLV
ncbi:MAG TPA: cytochrome c biogenesis heme-transporting ATPase CcmA [Gammaproteobacteria bacterium]